MSSVQPKDTYAAIDLGSNSFHMVVAMDSEHGTSIIDRAREMVRLASGLDGKKTISNEAQTRALDCLYRFGQRLRGLDEERVRVVGTNTLREAKNSKQFIRKAEQALGFPIDIISGVEEARLIYRGVSQTLQGDRGRRLVIDIGGGSTELIVGDKDRIVDLESLYMGCVSYTDRFLKKGKIGKDRMRKAILAAQLELEPHARRLKKLAFVDVIGTSGTARAIDRVIRESGWDVEGINNRSIEILLNAITAAGTQDKLSLRGLGTERHPVFAGGVAVMVAIIRSLNIERMRISDGSLREGVLAELIGVSHQMDTRQDTVHELVKRHRIDTAQSERVYATAQQLFQQVGRQWSLLSRHGRLLGWAARLHEIGLSLAHSQYHRHGAYMLEHMDLPGFSRTEQVSLSILVRLHRRKFELGVLEPVEPSHAVVLKKLSILLRLSVLLNRGREESSPVPSAPEVDENKIRFRLPDQWVNDHPLTYADLLEEQGYLKKTGFRLVLDTVKA